MSRFNGFGIIPFLITREYSSNIFTMPHQPFRYIDSHNTIDNRYKIDMYHNYNMWYRTSDIDDNLHIHHMTGMLHNFDMYHMTDMYNILDTLYILYLLNQEFLRHIILTWLPYDHPIWVFSMFLLMSNILHMCHTLDNCHMIDMFHNFHSMSHIFDTRNNVDINHILDNRNNFDMPHTIHKYDILGMPNTFWCLSPCSHLELLSFEFFKIQFLNPL